MNNNYNQNLNDNYNNNNNNNQNNDYYNQQEPYQEQDQDSGYFNYSKTDIRINFIRKVYLILSSQLILTASMSTVAMYSVATQNFLINNIWLLVVSFVFNLVSCYALVCYKSCSRTVPNNYILLFVFTFTEAYLLMFVTAFTYPENVFIALVLTAAIVISLTIYAFKTEKDFTIMGGLLFMVLIILFVASILAFFIQSRIFDIIISSCTVILFGFYLIFDTQLIIGRFSNSLSLDDYILGALMLYVDIIRIFLEILKILAALQKK